MMNATVLYARESTVSVPEFRRVLIEAGMDQVRPVADERRLEALLRGANLIVTARLNTDSRPLVGIARCVTDFSWCCYVPDLAVSASAQGHGVGRELLDETRRLLGPQVSLVLLSYPGAVGFYEKIGMARCLTPFVIGGNPETHHSRRTHGESPPALGHHSE